LHRPPPFPRAHRGSRIAEHALSGADAAGQRGPRVAAPEERGGAGGLQWGLQEMRVGHDAGLHPLDFARAKGPVHRGAAVARGGPRPRPRAALGAETHRLGQRHLRGHLPGALAAPGLQLREAGPGAPGGQWHGGHLCEFHQDPADHQRLRGGGGLFQTPGLSGA
ncbi:unnamed protein product, partial [Effrenium voratum]